MSALQKNKIRVPQDVALFRLRRAWDLILFILLLPPFRKPLAGMAIKVANMIWSEIKNGGRGKYRRQVVPDS
jgi:hypothetical protein